ncbi:MerR family transcriptional regulator [Acinetobacter sp. ANC 3791]|uniref:MerR family transcriptional regulator n=1 Tax=Acinetobacter sp. ANC 3791 TaxID=2529836 RepID=UPI0010397F75|nr:MerR family transcriptional regulator [Acinetobacter sp. ANC 3791]TCB83186.1 MerR family transcriptional regulator [Acinetobacter sp. ANC 3791]
MYIGQLAACCNTTPKAIRHYEQLGLLPEPKRLGKYRVYSDLDIRLVKMIRQAQTVGFSLAEIQELAHIKAQQQRFPLDIAKQLMTEKWQKLEQQKQHLIQLQQDLLDLDQTLTRLYADEEQQICTDDLA